MSLLADHGDENRDEREAPAALRPGDGCSTAGSAQAAYPQLVLGLAGNNSNSNHSSNGNGNGNGNYRYSFELASRAKLSPISASGVFSKYNVFSPLNHSNSTSNSSKQSSGASSSSYLARSLELPRIIDISGEEEEGKENDGMGNGGTLVQGTDVPSSTAATVTVSAARTTTAASDGCSNCTGDGEDGEGDGAPFKKFRNPFASSVVSSFGTLELSGVTKGSFTTISISTIESVDNAATAKPHAGSGRRESSNTTLKGYADDGNNQLDRILRIAKKLMGDELIEDLIASGSPTVREHRTVTRRFGFPAMATTSSYYNDKIESVGEFVETVIEKELTLCSWTCELTIRQDFADLDDPNGLEAFDGLDSDVSSVQFSFASGVSTGTVVRHHLLQQQPSLVFVHTARPRKRDWFLRLFHWHHHPHRRPVLVEM